MEACTTMVKEEPDKAEKAKNLASQIVAVVALLLKENPLVGRYTILINNANEFNRQVSKDH